MCGITGGVWTDPEKAVDVETLRRMVDVLRHRGPDGRSEHLTAWKQRPGREAMPGVALGNRWLALLDIAKGQKPACNEDETVWGILDGEIYNRDDLRRRLEGAGHRLRTRSDAEKLVHLYEDEGPAFLRHLNGVFAVTIWDATRCQLVLARDRLGRKPLIYHAESGRLLFASEIKSLLEVADVPRDIDPGAVDAYLTYGYVPHPKTILRNVAKLPPGHVAVYRDDQLSVSRYWQPGFNTEEPRPTAEYGEALRETMIDSVRLRLQSDVPIGVFLSSCLAESSIIVGLMRQLSDEPIRTFSGNFHSDGYAAADSVRVVAKQFDTIHEEFRFDLSVVDILPKLMWHFDEPLADRSVVSAWRFSQLARGHVAVTLTGDGGDELSVGHRRYRAMSRAARFDRLPQALRRVLAGNWWRSVPTGSRQRSLLGRAKRLVENVNSSPVQRYLTWVGLFDESRRAALYSDDFLASLPNVDPQQFLAKAFSDAGRRSVVTAAGIADLLTFLPCNMMPKIDIASMAHGLECRQPFLDHRVVELVARMPLAVKFRRGFGRRILAETFADFLPTRGSLSIGREGRVPLGDWFGRELKDFSREVLLDASTLRRNFFRKEVVARLLDDHEHGVSGQRVFDPSADIWALLMLELWCRQWID